MIGLSSEQIIEEQIDAIMQYLGRNYPAEKVQMETELASKRNISEKYSVYMKYFKLDGRDVIKTFPAIFTSNNTALILKKPKTKTSVRRVWLPKTVAEMLVAWKKSQSELKEFLGDEYHDFNMVIALPNSRPLEGQVISRSFKALIREHDLPDVVFHSLRHTSTTYKLKLNRGDMKAVQGDTGHAQLKMVSDVYSHILDEDRRKNAAQFEEAFYHADKSAPIEPATPCTATETEKVMELLNRTPELAAQLLQLLNIANSKTAVMVGGN